MPGADVTFHPEKNSYWLFRDQFMIPNDAENLTGQILAVADNAEEVWFGDAKLTKSDPDFRRVPAHERKQFHSHVTE